MDTPGPREHRAKSPIRKDLVMRITTGDPDGAGGAIYSWVMFDA